jgi:phosphoribosylformylglycinamidine cyclo-ligase
MIERLVAGVAKGCELAGCALVGGETAELPDVYKPGDYDLAGFSLGVVELARAMDATRVEPGDVVLGLESDGVHSNGFSLVRKIIDANKLKLGKVYPELDLNKTLGEALLTPTRIYAQQIVRAQRAYKVKKVITGMAHITGGGLAGNLVRSLPSDANAEIDWSTWETPPVFRFLAERGGVEEAEMRRVFNMGIGYCLIVRPGFADATAKRLEKMGERVHTIGRITKGTGKVVGKRGRRS